MSDLTAVDTRIIVQNDEFTSGDTDREKHFDQSQRQPGARETNARPIMNFQSAMAPASVRAMQIDAAVRLENATAQPLNDSSASAPATRLHHQTAVSSHGIATEAVLLTNPAGTMTEGRFEHPQFSGQILRGLAAMLNQRGGVMNMRLDPPDLGELRVRMTLAQGVVSAEFQAATQQAHGLLEKNLMALRTALEGQGLTVDRLSVHIAPASGQQSMRDEPNNNSPHSQQRDSQDAAGGESRGRRDGHDRHTPRRQAPVDFSSLVDRTPWSSYVDNSSL